MPFLRFEVAQAKLLDYLLNPLHPKGGSKARLFASHGFSRARPTELGDALRVHAVAGTARSQPNAFGSRLVVEGALIAPDGEELRMRTVWQVAAGSDVALLVTAYPVR